MADPHESDEEGYRFCPLAVIFISIIKTSRRFFSIALATNFLLRNHRLVVGELSDSPQSEIKCGPVLSERPPGNQPTALLD
ncbi:hypothetical protein AVEN_51223-1 [Araneus ventricosus]|uniref:Uncharacterized protein n=1 Tax=Araneus ventricosus TaxID=182803 RepID=A0A4Y2GKF9_ARAVE|nr:hypothetical protein AVEN_18395-1 [Araneus ventricosus]GBM53196.1 hypothetical protein AVEN_51223-1 [Araneus ventricosus]